MRWSPRLYSIALTGKRGNCSREQLYYCPRGKLFPVKLPWAAAHGPIGQLPYGASFPKPIHPHIHIITLPFWPPFQPCQPMFRFHLWPRIFHQVSQLLCTCKDIVLMVIDVVKDVVERTAVWDLNKVKSTRKGLTEGDQTTVEIIKELREVLNGKCNISVLSRGEVRDLLDYLCTG